MVLLGKNLHTEWLNAVLQSSLQAAHAVLAYLQCSCSIYSQYTQICFTVGSSLCIYICFSSLHYACSRLAAEEATAKEELRVRKEAAESRRDTVVAALDGINSFLKNQQAIENAIQVFLLLLVHDQSAVILLA